MKRSARIIHAAAAGTAALLVSCLASAQSAEEILEKVDEAGLAETSRMELTQKVVGPGGGTRTFRMVSHAAGGLEKGLTEYLEPSQVRGMKILTLDDGDDIWVYFPRTNRTRKIASSARNRRVQGSDFTYDDMATGRMAEQWSGELLGSDELDGDDCYKLSIEPTDKGPQTYSKAVAWVRKADHAPLRVDYWDLDGDRCKRLVMGDYREIDGVLLPFEYTMTNLLDGGRTEMRVDEAEVGVSLRSSMFNQASLGR
ncbi:MAG: outer membrane lipoprotein-sorting protein [Polyangia bacterium]